MAESANKQTVALPAVVDLDTLDSVRDGLIDALEVGPAAVDGSRVERVSTNALIMLLSAAETARRNGFRVKLQGPSAQMLVAIDRLGFSPSFAGLMKG
jgi:anti-anti-sigma regulatory factor